MLTKTKNKTSTILALKHHLGLEHFHKSTIKTHEELEHFCNTSTIKTIIFLEGLRKDHQKLVQKSYHHWLSTISKVSTTFFTIFFSNLLPFVFIYVKKQREKKVQLTRTPLQLSCPLKSLSFSCIILHQYVICCYQNEEVSKRQDTFSEWREEHQTPWQLQVETSLA